MDLSYASSTASRPWPLWRWLLLSLCAIGLALSSYLSWHYLKGGSVIGCGGGSGCDQVLGSQWSSIRGVLPVSGLAMGAYLAMLVAVFFTGPRMQVADRRLAWGALLLLAGASAGSALWFIGVQKWEIGAFCPYCMATHITSLLLAALVIWQARRQWYSAADTAKGVAAGDRQRLMGWPLSAGMPTAGLAMAAVVAVFQLTYKPPPKFQSGQVEADMPALPTMPEHAATTRATPRALAVPIVGSAKAKYFVKLLFDYKCPHCQKVHGMLDDVIKLYDGKVAFVLCPSPLNTKCNPYVSRDVDQFKESCDLARLAMAVWVAKGEAFADFDRWMFTAEPEHLWHGRTLEAAQAKAVELVGEAPLKAAMNDPWIDTFMKASVDTYGNTINADQTGSAVPKLVYEKLWVTPQPNDAAELVKILQDELKLPQP